MNYTAGTFYKIVVHGVGPSGLIYNQPPVGNPDRPHGSVFEISASFLADKTLSGFGGIGNSVNEFTVLAVEGDTTLPTVLLIGDSIFNRGAAGHGDTFDGTSPYVGFGERVLGAYGIVTINVSVPGETAASFVSNHALRAAAQGTVTDVWCEYGINDIAAGTNPATAFGYLQSILGYFPGKKFVQSMIGYEVTSTDSFLTETNQTPNSNYGPGGTIDTLNASIAGWSGVGIADHRSAIYDVPNHKWLTNGTTTFWMTPDGIHPSQLGAQTIGSSGLIPASLF